MKCGPVLLRTALIAGVALCAIAAPAMLRAQGSAPRAHYEKDIAPLFAKNCVGCHSGAQPKGDILLRFKDEGEARAQVANDEFWDKVAAEVESGRMPPATSKQRPTDANDWMTTDAEIACPDPNCSTRLRITRTGLRRFRHGATTAVPLPEA